MMRITARPYFNPDEPLCKNSLEFSQQYGTALPLFERFHTRQTRCRYLPPPLKAGYTVQREPHTGSSQAVVVTYYGNHQNLGLHGLGQRPHAFADRPNSLTPSTSPRLGVSGQHQELHRCALYGFLGPSSETTVPTRILRHLRIPTTF